MGCNFCDDKAAVRKDSGKTLQEGMEMKEFELRYVGSHVEVYSENGAFLFSADTVREAMEELGE